jgi:hypothetical protein
LRRPAVQAYSSAEWWQLVSVGGAFLRDFLHDQIPHY